MKHIGKAIAGVVGIGLAIGTRYMGGIAVHVENAIDAHVMTFSQTKYARRLNDELLNEKMTPLEHKEKYNKGLVRYVRTQFGEVKGLKQSLLEMAITRRFQC